MERGRNQVRLLILSDTSPQYFFSRREKGWRNCNEADDYHDDADEKMRTTMMMEMVTPTVRLWEVEKPQLGSEPLFNLISNPDSNIQ